MPNARETFEAGFIRGKESLRLRREGLTFREIAERLNVGRARAQQLVSKAEWRESQIQEAGERTEITDESPWKAARPHLTVRPWNALRNENVQTVGEVRKLVAEQSVELLRTPNFGRKSLEEVRAFLASIKTD